MESSPFRIQIPSLEFSHFGIRNQALGIRNLKSNPIGIRNSLSWNPESNNWDLESITWNPESKTVTDYILYGAISR